MPTAPGSTSALRAALIHEVRLQLRQPRTLLLLLLTALLLGPIGLQLGQWWVGTTEATVTRSAGTEDLPIAADAEIAAWIRPGDGLRVAEGPLAVSDPPAPDEVLGEVTRNADTVLLRRPVRVVRTSELTRRLEKVLERANAERRDAGLRALGLDPATYTVTADVRERDALARDGERAGRFLPGILVFLLITAALYTSVDVLTAEKEKGTAETLMATAVPRRVLLLAKTGVTLGITVTIGVVWAASLYVGQATGWLDVPQVLGDSRVFTASGTAVLIGATVLLGAQITAATMALAAWAPGFRQASVGAVPLMLLLTAPTGLAALPGVELNTLVAVLPIANVSVALRTWLAGGLHPVWVLGVGAATLGHAVAALAITARVLDRGDPLDKGLDAEARRAAGRFGPDALGLFAVVLVCFWFLGTLAQATHLHAGLAASQAGFALAALGGVWFLGADLRETLSLRAPRPMDVALGLGIGVTMTGIGQTVRTVLDPVLPVSQGAAEGMARMLDAPFPLVLLVAAVLPGLCEELLSRGALLGMLRSSVSAPVAIAVSAAMFGVLHLEPARIPITGAVGLVLGAVVVRAGSLWPAVLAHTVYNGTLLSLAAMGWDSSGSPWLDTLGWAGLGALSLGGVWSVGRQNSPS